MLPGVLPTGPVLISPDVVLNCGASTIKNARFWLQYSCKVEIVGASVSPGTQSKLKISTLSSRYTPPVGFDVAASSKFWSVAGTRTEPSAPPAKAIGVSGGVADGVAVGGTGRPGPGSMKVREFESVSITVTTDCG